ncbi:hypothetical protein HJG60_009415 [Phyllostomus discolor]|uniref:Uncharacterized protein n=1 Tax=Phyllostomus discolor TaxID=89673 RepID=A0A833YIG5_9CHIR|nr:hypothetical protein HJG60_009415 [Phyllostomus discolor]
MYVCICSVLSLTGVSRLHAAGATEGPEGTQASPASRQEDPVFTGNPQGKVTGETGGPAPSADLGESVGAVHSLQRGSTHSSATKEVEQTAGSPRAAPGAAGHGHGKARGGLPVTAPRTHAPARLPAPDPLPAADPPSLCTERVGGRTGSVDTVKLGGAGDATEPTESSSRLQARP